MYLTACTKIAPGFSAYKGNYEKRNIDLTLNIAVEVGDIVRVYSTIFENDFVGRVLRVEHSF
jgi:transcription antitermination factor NusG